MNIIKKIIRFPILLKARHMTSKANTLLSKGEHDKARELYLKLEEQGFVNYMIYHNIGTIFFEEGDFSGAEEYLTKAVGTNQKSVLSYSLLSEVYLRTKQWTKAENAASKALDAEPFNYFVKKRRDKVFNTDWRREYVRSLENTESAARSQREGNISTALKSYETAIGADSKNALAHFLYGGLLFKEGQKAEGLEHISIAVEIEPGNRKYSSALNAYQRHMREESASKEK